MMGEKKAKTQRFFLTTTRKRKRRIFLNKNRLEHEKPTHERTHLHRALISDCFLRSMRIFLAAALFRTAGSASRLRRVCSKEGGGRRGGGGGRERERKRFERTEDTNFTYPSLFPPPPPPPPPPPRAIRPNSCRTCSTLSPRCSLSNALPLSPLSPCLRRLAREIVSARTWCIRPGNSNRPPGGNSSPPSSLPTSGSTTSGSTTSGSTTSGKEPSRRLR